MSSCSLNLEGLLCNGGFVYGHQLSATLSLHFTKSDIFSSATYLISLARATRRAVFATQYPCCYKSCEYKNIDLTWKNLSEWLPINSRESELQTCNILFPKPFEQWKRNDVCEGWTNKNKGKRQPCREEGHTRKNKSHWLLGEWNSERGFLLRDGWCRWQGDRLEWCCLGAASHLIFFFLLKEAWGWWQRLFLPHPAKEGEAFLCYKLGCKDTWHMFPSWKGLFAFALKNIYCMCLNILYIFSCVRYFAYTNVD